MKKKTIPQKVQELREQFTQINFPEYQREPNIWSRSAKQRLIDSIVREFDIASLYFYIDADDVVDCIDGRQRIGAIMSFLCENPEDGDNGFEFRILNEIYADQGLPYAALDGMRFVDLVQREDELARGFVKALLDYELTVVNLSRSGRPEEFNLQFTRLNLGTPINSGEKLHAMVGDLRDVCFAEGRIGQHPFLESTRIPTRRYAREQVAAQILAQIFSLEDREEFTRTRHFDMQRLFKEHSELDAKHKDLVEETKTLLDTLNLGFGQEVVLKNRAITVSTVLLAWKLKINSEDAAKNLAKFVDEFVHRLKWQVGKELDVDQEYRYLIDFQRHVTQASVEKPAVEARDKVLTEEFEHWTASDGQLHGDKEFQERTNNDPAQMSRA